MEIDPTQSEAQALRHRSEALKALSTTGGSISSSISKLSGSSRVLPSEKDFHFYYNFDEFRAPIDEISAKSQSMLQQIGSANTLIWKKDMGFPQDIEDDDAYDWLVNVNDEIIERFDMSVDEFSRSRKKAEEGARAGAMVDENGFQLVSGKKKKAAAASGMREKEEVVTGVRVAERDKKTVAPRRKVPFHIPTIRKPQEEYNILVNNSNQPFQHVWLERSEDGSRAIHPLEKLSVLDFVDRDIESLEPVKPSPLESTAFKLVEEVKDLKELAAKLRSVNEFAVDLEHNQYRSFQGLTCLMQISTRTEDFVVDTLKLRIHIGPYLRELFKDPTKKKVMHGADRDVVWLQRDFGIYVCNLFDTGQASRVLQMERNSLEHLLQHFCGVTANKEYQNADWRLRPLPVEMLRYAREDTHYLLYIYDLMRIRLRSECTDTENSSALLLEVYKRSYDVCMQLYEKELLADTSYLYIYGVQGANLSAQQLAVVAGLCQWRDNVARAEDESTGYILPNKVLLEIAKQMPLTANKLQRLVKSKHPYVERNLNSVVNIIRHAVKNASSFESVAEQLKEGRIQGPELNGAGAGIFEFQTMDDISGEFSDGSQHENIPAPLQLKEETRFSFMGIGQNGNLRKDTKASIIPDSEGELFSCTGYSGNKLDTSTGNSGKVAEATVQVLKKPSRAFGAMLGGSASKKKTDFTKDKSGNKLEEIKSSVNLPFYSFSPKEQSAKQAANRTLEEPNRSSSGTLLAREQCAASASCSNSEDIILLDNDHHQPDQEPEESHRNSDSQVLEKRPSSSTKLEDIICLDSDSNDEEAPADSCIPNENHVNTKDDQASEQPELVILDEDEDEDDEPMSLSDLSSSFQKCLHSVSDKQITKENDGLQFEPFDYEAARKEVKFGEKAEKVAKSGDDDGGGKKVLGKKKNVAPTGRGEEDEGGIPQGRRRQAFPVTGNRSATFR